MREDGSDEVNSNLKVSDLHSEEWREVLQACPDKSEKGWKTIYDLVKTRVDQLTQTKQELKIELNQPLKEQDPLNELINLANKKRKRTSDLRDHSSTVGTKVYAAGLQLLEELLLIDQGLGSTSGIRAFALRNFDLKDMEFESAQSNTTAKLPILKLGNGNSWVSVPQTAQENGTSVTKMSVPVTTEEKTNKKNDFFILRLEDFWMNKAEVKTISIDDLYNNFKIVEQSVKRFVGASSGDLKLVLYDCYKKLGSTIDVNNAKTCI
ncbi:hypothetical protein Tco_0295435 [Tanacetum coccineum]